MTKIALITEGITDQYIIRPIIENYFENKDFVFRPISPSIDETDKQTGFGSWTNVINTCQVENFEEILNFNDYIVIQIDADISYTKGFDVSHSENGIQIEQSVLCNKVIDKLISVIPTTIFTKFSERFIFAIGILTMECWLLTTINPLKNKNITNNCLFKINELLAKKNIDIINPNDKNSFKSKSIYKKLSGNFKNRKEIEKYSKYNIGFQIFIEQLVNKINDK